MAKPKDRRSLGEVLEIRLGAWPPRVTITSYHPNQRCFDFLRAKLLNDVEDVDEHEGDLPPDEPFPPGPPTVDPPGG